MSHSIICSAMFTSMFFIVVLHQDMKGAGIIGVLSLMLMIWFTILAHVKERQLEKRIEKLESNLKK